MPRADDQFHRLSELFDEFVDLGDGAREAALQELKEDDPELATELRRLIVSDAIVTADDVLADAVAVEASAFHRPDVTGHELGSWRILRAIGEGGMGTVYLAERADGAYEALAAVKLVRGGVPSHSLDERFRSERQILAGLSHPGVAKLLDGGNTDDGTPYLVMEYIDGKPITAWCTEQGLDLEARLRLFLRVCSAVAYAHGQLVAHRDLKPSNILVSSAGEPKLLDFGIAKLLDTMGESGERVTQSYALMTPAYSSPEQVSGERVSAAADIYSLGVLLFELLSGQLPINTRGLTPAQLITKVTQEVPAVVSSVVEDEGRRKRLAGDLDAIVSRALRKEPEGRYPSVEALAEDVRLHLGGLPIRTRSDDWSYRTGKFVRRNLGAVSGTLLMVLLGISFTVNTVLQARAVARERDRAEVERATAIRVSSFLEELFTESDPNAASARDVTLRDVLDRGAREVFTSLDEDPRTRAAMATVIGRSYRSLGEYEAALPLLDSALVYRRLSTDVEPELLAEAYQERGALAYEFGEYEDALELHQSGVQAFVDAGGGDSHALASAMEWVAIAHADMGDVESGEQVMREAVAMHRRVNPEPNEMLATALKALQDVLRGAGQNEEAVELGFEALAMSREVYGNDHLETAHALNQLGSSLRAMGRAEEAIPLVEEGFEIRAAVHGGPHVETAASLGNLANMLASAGRETEAIAPRRASVAMLQEIFPPDHPYVAGSTASLGAVLLRNDSLSAAEVTLQEGLRYSHLAFGEGHPQLAPPMTNLGIVYRRTGQLDLSLAHLQDAYEVRTEALPEGHWHTAVTALELGLTYEARGEDAQADPYLVEAHRVLSENFGRDDSRTVRAATALREHLARRGLMDRLEELGPESSGESGGS